MAAQTKFAILHKDAKSHIVYGYGMISLTSKGAPVVDLQDDMISPADLEKAAVDFMLESRAGGVMHGGASATTVVSSVVFTPELQKALGVPDGILPVAWLIGVRIDDESLFKRVMDGELTAFSIQGSCEREEVAA